MRASTLGELLFDLEARIEGIFPLSFGDFDGLPEWFEDFCEDGDGAAGSAFRDIPALAGLLADDGWHDPAMVADRLFNGREVGFVCKIAWCRRRYETETIFVSGWGLTTWRWVYGKTPDEAVAAALAVVVAGHEKSRAEAPKDDARAAIAEAR